MNINNVTWEDSIWFSDLDDTLINTADTTEVASGGIKNVFAAKFGEEIALQVQNNFIAIFRAMMAGLRNKSDEDWQKSEVSKEAYDEVWKQVDAYQSEIKEKWGSIRKFSREVFIKMACDKEGIACDADLVQVAADAYWMSLSENVKLLPGVKEFVDEIKKHGRPLYLLTGSDARLKLKENGKFEYFPEFSEAFKRKRVELMRNRGLDFNIVSIGDPEDKPHVDFFEKAIHAAEADFGQKIDLTNSIIIGDSFAADLQTPKEKLNFGLVVLFQEGKEDTEVNDEHQITTGNLQEVTKLIS